MNNFIYEQIKLNISESENIYFIVSKGLIAYIS